MRVNSTRSSKNSLKKTRSKLTSTSIKKIKTNVSIKAPTINSLDRSVVSEAEAEVSEAVSFVVEDVFVVRFPVVFSHVFDVEDVVIERIYVQLKLISILSKVSIRMHAQLVVPLLINLTVVLIRIFRPLLNSHRVIQPFVNLKISKV